LSTKIIVNCARSNEKHHWNAVFDQCRDKNPAAALRNGTIGWTLAKFSLDHGRTRRDGKTGETVRRFATERARRVADRAGVQRASLHSIARWFEEDEKTIYRFDVRTPEEYEAGHVPGFRSVPGGQLVQEADYYAPVQGGANYSCGQ
jgi:3-mercaptopyruvate sulfurtransferase SseA